MPKMNFANVFIGANPLGELTIASFGDPYLTGWPLHSFRLPVIKPWKMANSAICYLCLCCQTGGKGEFSLTTWLYIYVVPEFCGEKGADKVKQVEKVLGKVVETIECHGKRDMAQENLWLIHNCYHFSGASDLRLKTTKSPIDIENCPFAPPPPPPASRNSLNVLFSACGLLVL